MIDFKKYIFPFVLAIIFVLSFFIKLPYIILVVAAFYVVTLIRIFSKAITAYLQGDFFAKEYITFDLTKHMDVFGLLMLSLLIYINSLFIVGFTKPIIIRYNLFKKYNLGIFLIGFVPLLTTFLTSLIANLILNNLMMYGLGNQNIFFFLRYIVIIGISFTIFNLIPLPNTDMYYMVYSIADDNLRGILISFQRFGFFLSVITIYFLYSTGIFRGIYITLLGFLN